MPERDMTHLGEHDLLLFLDGEVDKARASAIDRHLAACWSCRARRDELQSTITAVVRAMDEVVLPGVPPPPGPWPGLEPRLTRLDEQLNAERRIGRWRGVAAAVGRASRVRRMAAAALVAIVAAIAVLQALTFRFAERGVTELPPPRIPVAPVVPERVEPAAATAPPFAATPAPVVRRALTRDEVLGLQIEALVRLDGVGALLGEQVTVAATPNGQVRVEALVETAARKAEIARALDSLAPRWAIDREIDTFEDARRRLPVGQGGSPVVHAVDITAPKAPVYDDLKRFFAEHAPEKIDRGIQELTGLVLEHSLQARLHARALTQLLSPVTGGDLRTLAPDRVRAWRTRVRDHAGALRRETAALRHAIEPIFFPAASAATSTPALQDPTRPVRDLDPWQVASRLFELTSAHDVAVGQAFALSARDTSPAHVKSEEFRRSLLSAEALAERLHAAMAAARPPAP